MPVRVPKYRKRPDRDVAFAEFPRGKREYFPGKYDSPESRAAYNRWLRAVVLVEPDDVTLDLGPSCSVLELVTAYLDWAKSYYRDGGKASAEYHCMRSAAVPLLRACDTVIASGFGPRDLKAARSEMVKAGWTRQTVNDNTSRVRRIFRWAVEHELIPPSVLLAIKAVAPIQKKRTAAPEGGKVCGIDPDRVAAAAAKAGPIVAAMIALQEAGAMRPQDVCGIRPVAVDRSEDVWIYRPEEHKNDWREGGAADRLVFLGPRAQAILKPFLDRPADAYCFSPQESESQRRTARGRGMPRPRRTPRTHYDTASYRRAITRACEIAFGMPDELRLLPPKLPKEEPARSTVIELRKKAAAWRAIHCWNPNQLRHNAATAIRAKYGLDGAQVMLGHSEADVAQVYAERDFDLGRQIAREMG